jgi:hypothetical protein
MEKRYYLILCLHYLLACHVTFPSHAQSEQDSTENKNKLKAISEVTKSCMKYPGLFNMYQDSIDGRVYMEISQDKLGKEFIHFFYVENGPLDAGWVKGYYGSEFVFSVNKSFNRIEFIKENPHYYFDPGNAVSKAGDADINRPVMSVDKIVASSQSQDTFLIEADKLFLTEALAQLKFLPPPGSKNKNPFKIGSLSKEKSRFDVIHNYPKNSDVVVNYVYENKYPTNFGRSTITDPRYISIQVQHSLIQMPENDYQPRFDDPRVGYFTTQVTDQTSTLNPPYRDLIHRWHLVKRNPDAALSEPVEPIVFWMENTTPEKLRPLVKKGVEAWNIAFEQAGFKNAIVVKQQPDDAEWEAGDLRYNVLRWTAAPLMGSAWGPSFVNPRTGQILGADIMLDYAFIRAAAANQRICDIDSRSLNELMFEGESSNQSFFDNQYYCEASEQLVNDYMFGIYLSKTLNFNEEEINELEENVIVELILHEVGHTLGLNHNFRASQLRTPEDLNDAGEKNEGVVSGSVMDYNPIHYSLDRSKQGVYRNMVPGPYDLWAIEHGYKEPLKDLESENLRMKTLLSRSTEPELLFGNDADAMGIPGRGIDPTVVTWDMSSDVVKYGTDLIQLSRSTMLKLKDRVAPEGGSYQDLLSGYYTCMYMNFRALHSIKHYIGGIKIDRAFVGQQNATQPFTPVDISRQKRAMNTLIEYGFSPRAFMASDDLYAYLQLQRRGFNFSRMGTEDPKIHTLVATFQKRILAHLLHPSVLKRITDTRLYGNAYSVNHMLSDLTEGIFSEDLNATVSTTRQNLQHIYVDGLISALINPKYDHISKSASLAEVKKIDGMMKSNKGKDVETKAHKQYIRFKINKALE